MKTEIDNTGAIGVLKDLPDSELPVNAFTGAKNVRFDRGSARKMLGDEAVFEASASLLGSPLALIPVQTDTAYYWVYPSETRIFATDGSVHVDITPSATASLTYTTDLNIRWNGGVLNGFPVMNNGADAPVYWIPSLSNDVAVLRYDYSASTTWADASAAPRCQVMRMHKEFGIAMDITENTVRNQRLLWWSHPAEAGDIPLTWDYTKTNRMAGQVELAETQGAIIDGLTLKNDFAIYKTDSIYRMSYVGLPYVFSFRKEVDSFGILSRDCVKPFLGQHLAFGQSDIVLHNFSSTKSIISNRMRRWLYSIISSDTYKRSFVLNNFNQSEMWCCFPESGNDYPNLALVWNWEADTISIRDLQNIVCGANGVIDPSLESTTFDGTSGSFDTDFGSFGETAFNPSMVKLVLGQYSATDPKVLLVDETNQFNGTNMDAYIERMCLPLGRQLQDGSVKVDTSKIKVIDRIVPRIRASTGAHITVSVGTQSELDGTVSWKRSKVFNADSDWKLDFRVAGRIMAVKFESSADISWSLEGYRVEWHYAGER